MVQGEAVLKVFPDGGWKQAQQEDPGGEPSLWGYPGVGLCFPGVLQPLGGRPATHKREIPGGEVPAPIASMGSAVLEAIDASETASEGTSPADFGASDDIEAVATRSTPVVSDQPSVMTLLYNQNLD
ncbi:hypothetical protein EOD39_13496 [Acipenser ruthenus]|uniref:Uncharacterized protein n=1 Tax=Acipenser ruthenus TaxID=7906 RepID=A0A662YRQ2_ACIRT|nr:hypothetical protein EOD39_13496 [Acipenser ruthenus]